MGSEAASINGEREDHRMSMEAAITHLIETGTLTPDVVKALNLKPEAVADFGKLPPETQKGMVDVLVDRFSRQLGGSWTPQL
jgi:Ni,Fe-hydrogenase maturation factor